MDTLNFRVSAELKNILGKDLITSPNIAILELVKNSYDAHAPKVEITFEEDSLIIADNGKGMTLDDLINKWLFLAYSAKSDGTEDKSNRELKRHYAGAKGIGRMSCDRLAHELILFTKTENVEKVEKLHVTWDEFEGKQKEAFDSIPITHESIEYLAPFFPDNINHGTILEFHRLRDKWEHDEIFALKRSLEKMVNPFSDTDNFEIVINAPQFFGEDQTLREEVARLQLEWDNLSDQDKGKVTKKEKEILNGVVKNSIVDVLKLKTTQIESRIDGGKIYTVLYDRGVKIYEIEEDSPFPKLSSVVIYLYYLNRAAKYSFSVSMGVTPVRYGNVFLFRNGFRIWPYGEPDDDSWGLNKRQQQGYNRFLGTRDLFGRVDVETSDVEDFKEVSSRDGGLIKTVATQQMHDYFDRTHHRLERYVSGVLWGEGFLKRDYFLNEVAALKARNEILEKDKDSDAVDYVYKNIGSRVDFLQLIKSLVNNPSIDVKYYNEELANVIANVSDTEIIQAQVIDDFRKLAQKTNDAKMLSTIDEFERQMEQLRKEKEDAERKAEEERQYAEEERRKAEEVRKRAEEEKQKRERAEKELEQKKKQNLFLQSISSLDVDRILKYHHDIRIHSSTITNSLNGLLKLVNKNDITKENFIKYFDLITRANNKIMAIAKFATKANFNTEGDDIEADIIDYIEQYINSVLPEFYDDKKLECVTNGLHKTLTFKPLEVSLLIDNLLSNSLKANATSFIVVFKLIENHINIEITDDGVGISQDIENPDTIFEKGVTTTNGSGLGLYNMSCYIKNELGGTIELDKTFVSKQKNRTGCRIIIKL